MHLLTTARSVEAYTMAEEDYDNKIVELEGLVVQLESQLQTPHKRENDSSCEVGKLQAENEISK